MLARIFSCAVIGLEGVIVEVEVDTGPGLPKMVIVGLPDAAVQESRERVRSAVSNAGFMYPRRALTVNLAPASVRKEGPAYDLPIALGVLAATRQLDQIYWKKAWSSANFPWTVLYVMFVVCFPWRQQPASRISNVFLYRPVMPPKQPLSPTWK